LADILISVGHIGEEVPFIRNVFTLRSKIKQIPGAETFDFHGDDKRMLEAWRDFVVAVDPDVVAGFNSSSLDLRILARMKALNIDLGPLGRVLSDNRQPLTQPTQPSQSESGSGVIQAHNKVVTTGEPSAGTQEPRPEAVFNGQVVIDIMRFIQKTKKDCWKLKDHQLNQVVEAVFGEELQEKPYADLCALARDSDPAKLRMAAICSLHVCFSVYGIENFLV
jgi:DNA polymerase delta subunit 1